MNLVVEPARSRRLQRRRRGILVATASNRPKPRQGRHRPSSRLPMPLLRSSVPLPWHRYKYAAPTVLPVSPLTPLDCRARCDRLVGLVDKLLALTPKLRAGPSGRPPTDAERHALPNAVTATDQQIDALVYDLYGLTPDEIKLVEGTA